MEHGHLYERRQRIAEVYVTQLLYRLGIALISIFIPIYLLSLGFSFKATLIFLLIKYVASAVTAPVAEIISWKLGFKNTMLLRIPFFVAHYLLLFSLATTNIPYIIPAIIGGIELTLYWMPMNGIFLRASHKARRGKEIGTIQSLGALVTTIAPAIGGIIAATQGFPFLILVALGIMAISIIPLFLTPEEHATEPFSWREFLKLYRHPFLRHTVTHSMAGAANDVLFPLFVYLTLRSTQSVGFLESLGAVVFALFVMLIGSYVTTKNVTRVVVTGAIFFGVTFLPRPFISSIGEFAAIVVVSGIAAAIFSNSHNTLFFNNSAQLGNAGDEFITINEVWIGLSRAFVFLLCILLIIMFGEASWVWIFVFVGIALIGNAAVPRKPIA